MDWITVAASAAVSAIISTLIGLGVASQTKVIQMRAEERENARREIVTRARDLQRRLLAHQDSDNPRGRRIPEQIQMDDLSTAWGVVRPARDLGWFRRWVTMSVARLLFGRWVVQRVPLMKDDSGEAAFTAFVREAMRIPNAPVITGSWHDALASPSKSPKVQRALLHLRWLEGRLWS